MNTMVDIIDVIEKYIELSVRRDNLNNAIHTDKKNYVYAIVEGDMAFSAGEYEREFGYNESAKKYIETSKKNEIILSQVRQLIYDVHRVYEELVSSGDLTQFNDALIALTFKKDELERRSEELSQRRNWAVKKGNVAFAEKRYEDETVYNQVARDCYLEVSRNSLLIPYYRSFIDDLKKHIDEKNKTINKR